MKVESGISLYNLLKIIGKTEEIKLIEQKYTELGLGITELEKYCYFFRTTHTTQSADIKEKNKNCFKIIKMLEDNNDIKDMFDDIWSSEESKSVINAELITVTERDIVLFKNQIDRKLSALNEFSAPPDDFYSILYAVIALKIYCERLKRNLILPETIEYDGTVYDESRAKEDFHALMSNPTKSLYGVQGKTAADFFNFKARVETQFGIGLKLPELMQQMQLTGKMISYLNKHGCLDRRFTKEHLIGDHVVTDFRPSAVKYIVDNFVKSLPEKNDRLSMFNPTGGWGGRLIGALATPRISRYVETDPNPDLLDVKNRIVNTFGSNGKDIHLNTLPIEDLDIKHYCPESEHFTANDRHDVSLFSPPYFDVEKYKDSISNTGHCQSYNRYPRLDLWIRDFLLLLMNINYRALRISGVMIINVAPIKVKPDLIDNLSNLQNMYPACIAPEEKGVVIDIPNIIKLELNQGERRRQWEHLKDLSYVPGESSNVLMFFKTKAPQILFYPAPIYKRPQNWKRNLLIIEDNGSEENNGADLKKPRL